jgi:hypothetical protein
VGALSKGFTALAGQFLEDRPVLDLSQPFVQCEGRGSSMQEIRHAPFELGELFPGFGEEVAITLLAGQFADAVV